MDPAMMMKLMQMFQQGGAGAQQRPQMPGQLPQMQTPQMQPQIAPQARGLPQRGAGKAKDSVDINQLLGQVFGRPQGSQPIAGGVRAGSPGGAGPLSNALPGALAGAQPRGPVGPGGQQATGPGPQQIGLLQQLLGRMGAGPGGGY